MVGQTLLVNQSPSLAPRRGETAPAASAPAPAHPSLDTAVSAFFICPFPLTCPIAITQRTKFQGNPHRNGASDLIVRDARAHSGVHLERV